MPKFREVDLSGSKWTPRGGNWGRRDRTATHSPDGVDPGSLNLFVCCGRRIRDGAMEATVRVWRGGGESGRLAFRYGSQGCYSAGLGGGEGHLAIVKHIRSTFGALAYPLAVDGSRSNIRYDQPYELRVEFVGDHIRLMHDGVTVLEARDDWHTDGHIGFDTYGQTRVEFTHLRAYEVPPVGALLEVLQSFPYTLRRDLAHHNRELQDEKDVQRVLWTILRSHFADLMDEETLGKFGLKHYQDDFGIPSLATIVEVKVIDATTDLKRLQEGLMVDAVGYFGTMTQYRHLVFFIYNKANRAVDTALVDALEALPQVAAVVIVPGVKL